MIWEAVDTILDKAWENNFRALIMLDDNSKIFIQKDGYDWKTHETLGVLCVYSIKENREYYYDISKIRNIILFLDDSRGNQTEKETTE